MTANNTNDTQRNGNQKQGGQSGAGRNTDSNKNTGMDQDNDAMGR